MLDQASRMGGIFAWLVFIHFAVDWIFQSHAEAMVKHNNASVRAKHCIIYTAGFIPFLILVSGPDSDLFIRRSIPILGILFLSHFVEDTYYPVLLWAKYIRNPPEFRFMVIDYPLPGDKIRIYPDPDEARIRLSETWITGTTWENTTLRKAQQDLDKLAFVEFINTTLGKILMIAIDQIIHIAFLIPVAYLICH